MKEYRQWATTQLIALATVLVTIGLLLYGIAQHTLGVAWSVLACVLALWFIVIGMATSFKVIDTNDKRKEAIRIGQLERQRAMRAWISPRK
jgi:hypothetical protein